jgi:hypothetical protein
MQADRRAARASGERVHCVEQRVVVGVGGPLKKVHRVELCVVT